MLFEVQLELECISLRCTWEDSLRCAKYTSLKIGKHNSHKETKTTKQPNNADPTLCHFWDKMCATVPSSNKNRTLRNFMAMYILMKYVLLIYIENLNMVSLFYCKIISAFHFFK